jgi:chemotaxis protein methyltransferase CheR
LEWLSKLEDLNRLLYIDDRHVQSDGEGRMQQLEDDRKSDTKNEDLGFNYLKRTIQSIGGIDCAYYRDSYLKRRISLKMKEKGYVSFAQYGKIIRSDPLEFDELIKFITVNYTRFYRDKDVYDKFKDHLLPRLFETKKIVRFLSAGCSTGEEPYTIAMLVKEYLGKGIKRHLVSIHAIDLDTRCLAAARKGEYPEESVADLDNFYRKKYFREANGRYKLDAEIKRMVRFKIQDITKPIDQRFFDVIICRNVFIYFTKEAKAKIIGNFHTALNDGGYLIIGKTETMPNARRGGFKTIDIRTRLFQKVSVSKRP